MTTLDIMENDHWVKSEENAISVLLRAVRCAVHKLYNNEYDTTWLMLRLVLLSLDHVYEDKDCIS